MPPTEEKVADAMREFDQNNDGVISFDEFNLWWKRNEIVYTIKRSEPILPKIPRLMVAASSVKYNNSVFEEGSGVSDYVQKLINTEAINLRARTAGEEIRAKHAGSNRARSYIELEESDNVTDFVTELIQKEAKSLARGSMTERDRDSVSAMNQSSEYLDTSINKQGSLVTDYLSELIKKEANALARGSMTERDSMNTMPTIMSQSAYSARRSSSSIDNLSKSFSDVLSLKKDVCLRIPKQAPVPVVCYRGTSLKTDIAGLLPNRLYHFKIRHSGSKSNSQLSLPLEIMTIPLPLEREPTIVYMTASMARIKWYPPLYGAYKFETQLRKHGEENWNSVFCGMDNMYVSTTLLASTYYEIRVFCINFQGR